MLRLYLYARVRFLMCILHTRPRVQQAPGVSCALSLGRNDLQGPGETRRGNAEVRHEFVIARSVCDEAIHSFFMPHDGLLRFARNDGAGG
jgi:hypothetical protein